MKVRSRLVAASRVRFLSCLALAASGCLLVDPPSALKSQAGAGKGGASGGRSGVSGGGSSGEADEAAGDAGMGAGGNGESGANDGGTGGREANGGEGGTKIADNGGSGAGGRGAVGGHSAVGGNDAGGGNSAFGGNDASGGLGAVGGSGAGIAGNGGSGGSAPALGCAKLSVPLDATTDQAHFLISLPSAIDLSNATTAVVSMHVYVQAGTAGTIFNFVQDSQYHYLAVTTALRPALSSLSGWQTLSFNVGAQAVGSTNVVKSDIRRVGIEINAAPQASGWSNPTIVYVDSITVAMPGMFFPFDTASSVSGPSTADVAGQVLWQPSGASDTTASGVTLSWQATCP